MSRCTAGESSPLIADGLTKQQLDARPGKDALQVDADAEDTATAGPSGQIGPLVEEMVRCEAVLTHAKS